MSQVVLHDGLWYAALGSEALLAQFDFLEHEEVVLDVLQRRIVGKFFDHLDGLGFIRAHGREPNLGIAKVQSAFGSWVNAPLGLEGDRGMREYRRIRVKELL